MKNNKWNLDSVMEGNVDPENDTQNNIGWKYKMAHLQRDGSIVGSIQCMNTGNWAKVEDFESISEFIIDALNNYERLKADNEVLLNALKSVQNIVSFLINTTPTGDNRDRLTHANILSLEAIKEVESK